MVHNYSNEQRTTLKKAKRSWFSPCAHLNNILISKHKLQKTRITSTLVNTVEN